MSDEFSLEEMVEAATQVQKPEPLSLGELIWQLDMLKRAHWSMDTPIVLGGAGVLTSSAVDAEEGVLLLAADPI